MSFGNYILKIQLIGYLPVKLNVSLDSLYPNFDLQTIQLTNDSKLLDGVDIVVKLIY